MIVECSFVMSYWGYIVDLFEMIKHAEMLGAVSTGKNAVIEQYAHPPIV